MLPAAVADKTAVAVLPFKLLTPNPEDEYLTVALADPVINRLSASGDLLVRPMSTVITYAKQTTDLMLVPRELDVAILVDGSIQKFGQRLRVNVQAWSVNDGSSRLSAKSTGRLGNLTARPHCRRTGPRVESDCGFQNAGKFANQAPGSL
jgi:TolB-like protein